MSSKQFIGCNQIQFEHFFDSRRSDKGKYNQWLTEVVHTKTAENDWITNQNKLTITNEYTVTMVTIPRGHITLRDDRIKTVWTEEVDSFALSATLVTQKLFKKITGINPSAYHGDSLPVESVSWLDAVRFCNALSLSEGLPPSYSENETVVFNAAPRGYRLPTEAEWQYACQAGTGDVRYGALDQIAWYRHNSGGRPHEVGQKAPNAWGLYDMLGNVWEWCSDLYDTEVYGTYRIFRGGGWADEPRGCMASNRRRSHPTAFRMDDLGFRIARSF